MEVIRMKATRLTLICVGLIVISLMLTGKNYARLNLQDIAGIWLFDEGKGEVAKDSSENGNDGKIDGAKWADGQSGSALSFFKGNVVTVPASKSIDLNDAITVTAWINVISCEGCTIDRIAQRMLDNNQLAAPWHIWLFGVWNGNKKVGWRVTTTDMADVGIDSSTVIEFNKWYHVAGTYKSGQIRVYVNGAMETEGTNITGKIKATTGELWIGKYWGGGCDDFDGTIDEFGIFNKVLTKDDISSIMEQGLVKATSAVSSSGKLPVTWGEIKQAFSGSKM
jgi:hypothetical protein